jgi:uncharacterized protein (PEP-CTERM system associated)
VIPLACAAVGLALAVPRAGHAQSLMPAAGADVRLGNLRQQYARAFQTVPPATTPGWTFTPAIDLLGGWTDTVPAPGGGTRSDFYTTITPSLFIQGNGPRVSATLSIAPELHHYLASRSQNSTDLNFNGQSHVTLVPDALFMDLRGAAFSQSENGGYGPNGTVDLSRQNQVQTTTFSASPYLQHRFGGFGLAEIGYSLAHTTTTGASGVVVSPFQPPVTNQSTLTTSWHLAFSSGEDFGRTSLGVQARHTDNSGTGSLNGAHRYGESLTLGYALTRTVQVSGSVGHEDIRYASTTPYHVNGLTWNTLVKLMPNPDASISIGYGHHDGRNSASLDASYAPTARVRLSAQYSEGLTTGQEDLLQALAGSDINGLGMSVDRTTGIPLSLGDNFFGSQTTPAYVRRFSLVATLLRDRDVFSFTVRHDATQYLTTMVAAPVPTATSSTGMSAGFAWQHDFPGGLNGNTYLQYGSRETGAPTPASQQSVTASVGLGYAFSQTLSGRAQYSYNGSLGGGGPTVPSYQQNLITVGLHKSF